MDGWMECQFEVWKFSKIKSHRIVKCKWSDASSVPARSIFLKFIFGCNRSLLRLKRYLMYCGLNCCTQCKNTYVLAKSVILSDCSNLVRVIEIDFNYMQACAESLWKCTLTTWFPAKPGSKCSDFFNLRRLELTKWIVDNSKSDDD